MVTTTLYSNSQIVIVDIGSVPPTEPWLEQTTYLIDLLGRTTVVLAQTDLPTVGSSLVPVPYTATSATAFATASATTAPAPTGLTSRRSIPNVTVAVTVIGVVTGIAITIALVYYFRRRIRNNRLRTKSLLHTPQATARAWPAAYPVPSWDGFLNEAEEYVEKFDESTVPSSDGNGSGLGDESSHGSCRPGIKNLRGMYDQLWGDNQQSFQAGSRSSNTYVVSPARHSPPTRAHARAYLGQPTSILKHPAPPGIANVAQGRLGNEDGHGHESVPATRKLAQAKKSVRFGVDQIREFGRTPFGSTVGSPIIGSER